MPLLLSCWAANCLCCTAGSGGGAGVPQNQSCTACCTSGIAAGAAPRAIFCWVVRLPEVAGAAGAVVFEPVVEPPPPEQLQLMLRPEWRLAFWTYVVQAASDANVPG